MKGFCGVLGLMFAIGTAEAKPWIKPSESAPSVAPTLAPPPVTPPPANETEVKKVDYKAKYVEAQGKFEKGKDANDATLLAESALLFAEVAGSQDALADNAMRRFGKAIDALRKVDAPRVVQTVVTAWRNYGQQGAFNGALEAVYTQLAADVRSSLSTVTVASAGRTTSFPSCEQVTQGLGDLITISRELGRGPELIEWRLELARQKAGGDGQKPSACTPTPESLVESHLIYVELGKPKEADVTAVRAGDAYLDRFRASWLTADFTNADVFWGKGKLSRDQRTATVRQLAESAESAKRYEAAVALYEWLQDPTADDLRPFITK